MPQSTDHLRIPSARPSFRSGARVAAIGLAALIGVVGLSGCTPEKPEPTPSPTVATAEPGITDITDTPGSGENLVGALADTQVETCELSGDHWEVAGTVTNPTDAPASYRIYVSLLTAGGDTRSLTQVDVEPLEAGAEKEWSTQVALTDEDLTCVLRVERYAEGGEPTPEETPEG